MNKPIIISGLVLILGLCLWVADHRSVPAVMAADRDAHTGHEHSLEEHPDHGEALDALFAEDEPEQDHQEADRHAGHDHPREPADPHAGHGHAVEGADRRAGEACDRPAGHGHVDEHGHADEHGHNAGGICPEHRVPEAVDALCQAGHVGELTPGQGMKVRLAALDVAAKAGVRTSKPQPVVIADGTRLPGRVMFDREHLAHITPLASGVVRRVHVQPGAAVVQGQVLIELAMPELAGIKAELATSQAQLEQLEAVYRREQDLLERGITSRQEFQQAEADFRAAQSRVAKYRSQLLNFGLSGADLETLAQTRATDAVIALRAPFDGTVIEVQTATGEAVGADKRLVTLADLDALWIELAIPESQIYRAETGAVVQARFNGLPGRTFTGRLFQVGAAVDERTRTLTALAEVANPEHRLKVGMFGEVQILSGAASTQLMVPADAVQSIDGAPFLFVQEEPDLFELRRVQTGTRRDGLLAIVAGLGPDDQVVSGQGFALKSEVLKARLGASCADH